MIALLATLLIYTEFYIFTESKLNSISFNSMNSSVSKMSTRGPENLNECIEYTSRSGIAGSYDSSIFNFWGPSILIFIKAVPIYLPTKGNWFYLSFADSREQQDTGINEKFPGLCSTGVGPYHIAPFSIFFSPSVSFHNVRY